MSDKKLSVAERLALLKARVAATGEQVAPAAAASGALPPANAPKPANKPANAPKPANALKQVNAGDPTPPASPAAPAAAAAAPEEKKNATEQVQKNAAADQTAKAAAEAQAAAAAAAEKAAAEQALAASAAAEKLVKDAAEAESRKAASAKQEAATSAEVAKALEKSSSANQQNINTALNEIISKQEKEERIIEQNKAFVQFMKEFNEHAPQEVKATLIMYNKYQLMNVQEGFKQLETNKIKAISREHAYGFLNYISGPTKLYNKAKALIKLIDTWQEAILTVSNVLEKSIAEAKTSEFGLQAILSATSPEAKMNASPVKKIVENYLQLTVYANAITEAENSAPIALKLYRADKFKDALSAVAGGAGSSIYKFFTTGNVTAKKQLGLAVIVGICALAASPYVATGGLAALALATAKTAAGFAAANAALSATGTKVYSAATGKNQGQGTLLTIVPGAVKPLMEFASAAKKWMAGKPGSKEAGKALGKVVEAEIAFQTNPARASAAITAATTATNNLKPEAAALLNGAMAVAAGAPEKPFEGEVEFVKLLSTKFRKAELQTALSEVCGQTDNEKTNPLLIGDIVACVRKNPKLKAGVESKQKKKGGRRTRKQQHRRRRQTRRHR